MTVLERCPSYRMFVLEECTHLFELRLYASKLSSSNIVTLYTLVSNNIHYIHHNSGHGDLTHEFGYIHRNTREDKSVICLISFIFSSLLS